MKNKELRLILLMIISMTTWGLSWTNAKILGQYTSPIVLMVWRFLLASLSIAPIVYWSKSSFKLSYKGLSFVLINSVFMVSYNYFFFKGTQVGLAGVGGVLVTTLNPILTTLFSGLFLGEILLKKDWLGLLLGLVAGTLIIQFWSIDTGLFFQSGNIYFIMASISWVMVTILTSRSKNTTPYISYSFWSYVFSFFFCITFTSIDQLFEVMKFGYIFWMNLFFLGVAAMSLGTTIYFYASSELGPKKASAYIFIVPVTALGFAVLILNEPVVITTVIGGIFGIFAVYLINK